MNCPCCAAPLPPRGVVCAYCGNRRDVDLQGWAHLQANDSDEGLHCPDCRGALETLRLGDPTPLDLGRCPQCLGLFLPLGGLEQLLDQAIGSVWGVDHGLLHTLAETPRADPPPLRYRPCPRCGTLMNRSLHGKRSGVVVDRCRDHGLWLDAGELRQLLEWARAGGHLLDRQRRDEETERAERSESQRRRDQAVAIADLEGRDSWLESIRRDDLGTLLLRLARRLV